MRKGELASVLGKGFAIALGTPEALHIASGPAEADCWVLAEGRMKPEVGVVYYGDR